MFQDLTRPRLRFYFRFCVWTVLSAFCCSSIGPLPAAYAQPVFDLPAPGTMLALTPPYSPLDLKGIQVYADNPLRFDFLIDKGDSGLSGEPLKEESILLVKYFLAALTIPEEEMWVNLSPYEQDKITPEDLSQTLMGKVLLEQDYVLKQLMASLTYPEKTLGRQFWQRVYQKAYERFGTTQIPINTFNKVWIVPKRADVFEHPQGAFVVGSELDVMLESDYFAMQQNLRKTAAVSAASVSDPDMEEHNAMYSRILKEIILPELRKEVNEGKNFANLRQAFHAMVLATWYKKHFKDSLLGKIYVRQSKIDGVHVDDKKMKEKV